MLNKRLHSIIAFICLSIFSVLAGCDQSPLNNPHHPGMIGKNVFFSSFSEQPKTLDPARSYSVGEALFTGQIYEPPLQYDYFKEPYQLIPLTAQAMPELKFYNAAHQLLPPDANKKNIAYSVYTIKIKPGIYYQPHPAFAKDQQGNYIYHHLSADEVKQYDKLGDFKKTGTRELTADDYVYQIKRLAHPHIQSPIFGVLSQYILGFDDFAKGLQKAYETSGAKNFFDLRQYPFAGAKALDKYTYQIVLKGYYPQFIYWLAMPFFAPVPWEADLFYSQSGMSKNNLTFDWYPVGTGAYMLTENNPNREMVLSANPNFHEEFYPEVPVDNVDQQNLATFSGKRLPFIDQYIFSLEKESIPRWNKFLQGYYDQSGIGSEQFEQAVKFSAGGQAQLSDKMREKNIRLQTSVTPGIFFLGFNMLDPVVGGKSERARKLRLAISIAIDYEEFIAIFLNGRGIAAQSPLPPQIFGHRLGKEGMNSFVYDSVNGRLVRKPLSYARHLLSEAGYPNGRAIKTGKPLILNLDVASSGGPEEQARYQWLREQFQKLGIQLNIRATQYNRFQEIMRHGGAQLFFWGWQADYPDPENFLFLLYSKNSKAKYGGENAANYSNPRYDKLFSVMNDLPNGPKRQGVIDQMLSILQHDAPWVWGFYPTDFILNHKWVMPFKMNKFVNNHLKYLALEPKLREKSIQQWNRPVWLPLLILFLFMIAVLLPLLIGYLRKQQRPQKIISIRDE